MREAMTKVLYDARDHYLQIRIRHSDILDISQKWD